MSNSNDNEGKEAEGNDIQPQITKRMHSCKIPAGIMNDLDWDPGCWNERLTYSMIRKIDRTNLEARSSRAKDTPKGPFKTLGFHVYNEKYLNALW